MPLKTHVAAPGSIDSEQLTAKPAREGFVGMCTCTEPVRTGIGAVCVEYGRPKWPISMLNHTHNHTNTKSHKNTITQTHNHANTHKNIPDTEKCFVFYFWHPMLVRPAMKRLFCLKAKNGLGRVAPSALPNYYQVRSTYLVCILGGFGRGA